MTPEQFLGSVKGGKVKPVYLFVGPETYRRGLCRRELAEAALPEELRESGFARHDLDEVSLQEVLDDARSMSLFASQRLLWVASAELALPRGRAAASEDEGGGKEGASEALAEYCKDPTPGTVVVFDCLRYDFDGEDKARLERVRKFYGPVQDVVEFARMEPNEARAFALRAATERQLKFAPGALDLLAESTAGDPARIASEIEKMSLYFGGNPGTISGEEIRALVPNSSEATIFALVDALAHRDRPDALELLDRLVREGEYLPLALTFLGGIFRLALTAREANLRSAKDVMNHFRGQGVAMWFSRAEQIYTTSTRFSKEKLEEGIDLAFQADKALKSTRPDDRIVMEEFVMRLTA